MKQPIDSTKIQRTRRCKITSVEHQRWAAYATAALATSFSFNLANSAEAKIHYSGLINEELDGDSSVSFPLGDAGVIKFEHVKHYFGTIICTTSPCSSRPQNRMAPRGIQTITWYYDGGSAFVGISAPSGAVRGAVTPDGEVSASRLVNRDVISAGPFVPGGGFLVERSANQWGGSGYPRGKFQAAGPGAIAFKFNTGAGDQYGWARVRMDGFPYFTFRVVDYAYGDPGDVVSVGRPSSNDSAPTMESLGGLALGAAGLLVWRRWRANKRAAV